MESMEMPRRELNVNHQAYENTLSSSASDETKVGGVRLTNSNHVLFDEEDGGDDGYWDEEAEKKGPTEL